MSVIKDSIEKVYPEKYQLALRYQYGKISDKLDAEMFYVDSLLTNRRRFVDIGANVGIYTYFFSSRMQFVESFEPLREVTGRIEALANDQITLHHTALSNVKDELTLWIPLDSNGSVIPSAASIEPRDGAYDERHVQVVPLDSYSFDDVDLIKIDVEGHELRVLEGALDTINKCKPIIVVEIEQRHISMPIGEVFDNFSSLAGYDGYFLQNDTLESVRSFSYEKHQAPYLSDVNDKRYINNFIFKCSL